MYISSHVSKVLLSASHWLNLRVYHVSASPSPGAYRDLLSTEEPSDLFFRGGLAPSIAKNGVAVPYIFCTLAILGWYLEGLRYNDLDEYVCVCVEGICV